MSAKEAIEAGQEYRVKFPFVRTVFNGFGEDGPYQDESWRPGVEFKWCAPDDSEAVAEAEGEMVITVVDVHKPGRYPERVFYTRKWIDPDGREFGKNGLHMTTTQTFRKRASGYYHEYRLEGE